MSGSKFQNEQSFKFRKGTPLFSHHKNIQNLPCLNRRHRSKVQATGNHSSHTGIALETPLATVLLVTLTPTRFPDLFYNRKPYRLVSAFCGSFFNVVFTFSKIAPNWKCERTTAPDSMVGCRFILPWCFSSPRENCKPCCGMRFSPKALDCTQRGVLEWGGNENATNAAPGMRPTGTFTEGYSGLRESRIGGSFR